MGRFSSCCLVHMFCAMSVLPFCPSHSELFFRPTHLYVSCKPWCARRLNDTSTSPTPCTPSSHPLPKLRWPCGYASATSAAHPMFDSPRTDISGSSHTSDLEISTPVATLPGAWHFCVALGLDDPVSVYCDWVR